MRYTFFNGGICSVWGYNTYGLQSVCENFSFDGLISKRFNVKCNHFIIFSDYLHVATADCMYMLTHILNVSKCGNKIFKEHS